MSEIQDVFDGDRAAGDRAFEDRRRKGATAEAARWSAGVERAMSETTAAHPNPTSIRIDTSVAHPARRYDYLLGGKTHYAADRESADAIEAAFPGIRIAAQENRRFLRRAVTLLARERGIDQFLDVGTGIPSPGNTHEVAQAILPHARVLYADNDPVVLAHSQALLTSSPTGRTAYIQADLRDPGSILDHPQLAATLDLDRPVALMIVAVLHFLTDEDEPYALVERLVRALPSGSYLVISQGTWDFMPAETLARIKALPAPATGVFKTRTRQEIERFFAGTELVPPGVSAINRWHAEGEPEPRPTDAEAAFYGAVGRLP